MHRRSTQYFPVTQGWPLWGQLGFALGLISIALGVRMALSNSLGDRLPFVTVFIVLLVLVQLVRPSVFLVAAVVGCAGALYIVPPSQTAIYFTGPLIFLLGTAATVITAWMSHRAQARIRSADAMLRAFVDDSPTCKWVTDADGRIVYMNKAMADALGLAPEQVLGKTHAEILPPGLAKVATDHIRAVRESGVPRTSFEEIEPIGTHRERRILEWRRFLLRVGEKDRVLVAGMANDITQKARLEEALRLSERRLELALSSSGAVAWGWDVATNRLDEWGVAYRDLYGFSSDIPATFANWIAQIHPDDRQRLLDRIETMRKTPGDDRWAEEFRVLHPQRGERWIGGQGRCWRDAAGAPVRMSGVNVDITERKRNEQRLRLLADALVQLLSARDPDVVVHELFHKVSAYLDVETYFNFIVEENGQGLRLKSYAGVPEETARSLDRLEFGQGICGKVAETLRSIHATDIQHSDDPRTAMVRGMGIQAYACHPLIVDQRLLGTLAFASRTRPAFSDTELNFMRIIAQYAAIALERLQNARILETALGERTQDVTVAQQRLAASERMAAVGTLAAGLAHDLTNVILPLGARVDAVLSKGAEDEIRQELAVITALLDHLRSLASNLMLFARDPSHEGVEGVTELVAWRDQVGRLLDASVGSGLMHWDCPDNLPKARIAPHRLTQVVQNLVHNARDAIVMKRMMAGSVNESGRIVIECRCDAKSQTVVLRVIDNGCGMSKEVRQHCLEPFYTTKDRSASKEPGSGGSGLGLSLAQQIVERADGSIEIESESGLGTTVVLRLPVAAEAIQTLNGSARVSIEDKRIRAIVISTLRSLRYEVQDGAPEPASASVLWVTDGESARPDQAQEFLKIRPGRRVIAVGGNDDWVAVGAAVCKRDGAASMLRRLLAES